MTELAIPNWGALGALLLILWRTKKMTNATERLDASVARIAKDVGEVVERIRGNVGVDSAAVLADCDKLDALSEALEGIGATHGTEAQTPPAPQDQPTPSDQPQG
jgi:hypothetical protein